MLQSAPILKQHWSHPLFLHWPVDQDRLHPHLPEGLTLETHGGKAWLGIVAVHMTGTRPRGLPPIPRLSDALSLNVRTYVRVNGVPGLYFFSLDTDNAAVPLVSKLVGVPYRRARMVFEHDADRVRFTSLRDDHTFEVEYRRTGVLPSTALEDFLTERYAAFSVLRKKILRLRITHTPWSLRRVAISSLASTLLVSLGLPGHGEPIAFAGDAKEVGLFFPERVDVPLRLLVVPRAH